MRDGAQAEGVVFSPVAKIHVAKMLDAFGVDYIEGGYAASNPKDMAFFQDIKKENLKLQEEKEDLEKELARLRDLLEEF